MNYLFPHFPLHMNSIALFGLILLLGLIGGEIARRIPFLPRISGYIAIGFLFGPGCFNMVNHSVLADVNIFVEISLSLILFDLGRHLDFAWLRHDRGLLLMSIAESFITFVLIFYVLSELIGLPHLQSALAATIAVATSPAVVMMVAHDLSAEGPVSRRTLILTSLNNLFALILFTLLMPLASSDSSSPFVLLAHTLYRLVGSILFGLAMFFLLKMIAQFIRKQKDNQFVLFVGAVVLTIGLARALNLSAMLTLFTLGVAARNFDHSHRLMEIDFGWLARLFFIVLFVVTGVHLQLQGLWFVFSGVMIFVFSRFFAKMLGTSLFAKSSRLTMKQAFALGLTLLPMSGVAIGMSTMLIDFNPDFGHRLLMIITAAVAIFDTIGPILTQFAFIKTGEALNDPTQYEASS